MPNVTLLIEMEATGKIDIDAKNEDDAEKIFWKFINEDEADCHLELESSLEIYDFDQHTFEVIDVNRNSE